jgi:hypothetical protein
MSLFRSQLNKYFVHVMFVEYMHSVLCDAGVADAEQPLLMEVLLLDGLCVSPKDCNIPKDMMDEAHKHI